MAKARQYSYFSRARLAITLGLTVVALAITFSALPLANVQAQVFGAFTPFGGPILAVTVCAVPSAGLLLHIGPPRGGDFLLMPGSIIYQFGAIHPGAQTLGLAGPNFTGCFITVKHGLKHAGDGAPILFIGTSL